MRVNKNTMNTIKTATATKITFRKMGADYGDNPSVLAAIDALRKDVFPTNPCESWVHEYSLWADGYVWVVLDTTTDDSLAGIYAESEEEAIKYYTENYV